MLRQRLSSPVLTPARLYRYCRNSFFFYIGSCIIQQSLACCQIIKKWSTEANSPKGCELKLHWKSVFFSTNRSYQCDCDLDPCGVLNLIWDRLVLKGHKMWISSFPQITASSETQQSSLDIYVPSNSWISSTLQNQTMTEKVTKIFLFFFKRNSWGAFSLAYYIMITCDN